MATLDSTRTNAFRAASRALDHAIEAATEGSPLHPSGTTFIPADLAGSGRVASYRRFGPVAIVDADGNEIRVPQDHTREILVALAVIALAVVILARRPRALA